MRPVHENQFINELILQKAHAERSVVKPVNLAITANYIVALDALKNAFKTLFEERSHQIAITNMNQKRYSSNRFYTLHITYTEITLFEQYPTYDETMSFSIITGKLTIDNSERDENFTLGFFNRLLEIAYETKKNNAFLFHEPLDPKKEEKPLSVIRDQSSELRINGIDDLFTRPKLVMELQSKIGSAEHYFEVIDAKIFNTIIGSLQKASKSIDELIRIVQSIDSDQLLMQLKPLWVSYYRLL
ncbi:MAG: hypothetical protein O3A01_08415 [bacterium]|nr:hypothetical protein [bacterium]